MTKYTVILTEEAGSPYPIKSESHKLKNVAITTAKQWASENPDQLVYISFYRDNDGQHGYINPDGAGITGKSWTI